MSFIEMCRIGVSTIGMKTTAKHRKMGVPGTIKYITLMWSMAVPEEVTPGAAILPVVTGPARWVMSMAKRNEPKSANC
jgi:hypothetical protein